MILPAIRAPHILARLLRAPSLKVSVLEQCHHLSREVLRIIRNPNPICGSGLKALEGFARPYHGKSHRHGLENLVLDSPGNA
jgi:hypothetical protein